jgi:site-specific recombinase XerD
MKHLSSDQVAALIQAADTDRNELLFRLLYEHGLRISECLSLTRAHVRRGYLQIKGKKKGKRADEKINPGTLALFESVTKNLLPNTLIFPFSRQWASSLFHRACDKAGIILQLRQGVHSLRHSLAHHLLDAGAPLPVVQNRLRHRSIGSTGVYLEADGRDVDSWRARAITGQVMQAAVPVSLAEIAEPWKEALRWGTSSRTSRSRPVETCDVPRQG